MSHSSDIRSQLKHPVIDADGHWIESTPLLLDALRDTGGASAVETYLGNQDRRSAWYRMTPQQRLESRQLRPSWWILPTDTKDRATVMLPGLLYERLEEFGIDFAILYPTLGLTVSHVPDRDYRRAFARAVNNLGAELFAPYADRITPAAVIPTYDPAEALDELRYVTSELHSKVAFLGGATMRPLPGDLGLPNKPGDGAHYINNLVLDDTQDFDPLWAEFVKQKIAVTSHAGSMGWVNHRTVTNFTYNHIGHFAQANHAFARAVFLSGVVHRFPTLNFAFLEGGAGWAANLYADFSAHFRTRSVPSLLEHVRPTNLDMGELEQLVAKYGGDAFASRWEELAANPDPFQPGLSAEELTALEEPFDDFAACHVTDERDLGTQFTKNFFFGCEADDPMTAYAFDPHRRDTLKALFSSDIGHFDVTDMSEVLEEAYELLEDGYINEDEFRQFTFSNAVELHGSLNEDFFTGTSIEKEAKEHLSKK